ncbi:MAG: transposase, partial [Phototrophicales bacterium]
LCADALIGGIRRSFEQIVDWRIKSRIPMSDIMMSGYAVFSLKYPSLLAFEKAGKTMEEPARHNMKALFGIKHIPSDTYLREVIDEVDPDLFRCIFKDLFRVAQRGKVLKDYAYLDDHYLISIDGTGLFSS